MLSRLFMIQPSKILFDVDLYLNHASPLSSYIEMSNKKNHRQTSRSCGSDYFRPSYLIYGQSTLSESLNVSNAPPAIGIGLIGSLENASFNIILNVDASLDTTNAIYHLKCLMLLL